MDTQVKTTIGNKTAYVVIAVVLIALIGYAIWGAFGNSTSAETILKVDRLNIDQDTVMADGEDTSRVNITLTAKDNGLPASSVWVGLNIVDEKQASPDLTHFGWYSPEPGRSFYQTDTNGRVSFDVRSTVTGDITYAIYAANPGQTSSGKYESLDTEFTLTFK